VWDYPVFLPLTKNLSNQSEARAFSLFVLLFNKELFMPLSLFLGLTFIGTLTLALGLCYEFTKN